MSYPKKFILPAIIFFLSAIFLSCNEKNTSDKETVPSVILRKDTSTSKKAKILKSAPIINITDTIALKAAIILIKDSASTSLRLSQKLAQIYGVKLGAIIKQNNLKINGAPIAWYRTQKAPFFFEAGLPVDKKPARLPKNIFFRTIGGDSAVIAHFYGPYEQTGLAYEALNDWLKSRKKKIKSPAYEIYIGDPIDKKGNPVDPYRVQTDVVFPYN